MEHLNKHIQGGQRLCLRAICLKVKRQNSDISQSFVKTYIYLYTLYIWNTHEYISVQYLPKRLMLISTNWYLCECFAAFV